jgi:hypothetical protein
VTLPEGTPLTVSVETATTPLLGPTPGDRQAAFDAFIARAHARPVPHLPDEATRRENIYED